MRTSSLATAIVIGLCLSLFMAAPVQAGGLQIVDPFDTPINLSTSSATASQYDSPIQGTDPLLGAVSRRVTISQLTGTGTSTAQSSGQDLTFNGVRNAQMVLDYQFTNPLAFYGVEASLQNLGTSAHKIALFIEESAPSGGNETWYLADSDLFPPGPRAIYTFDTNYSGLIYGVMFAYNPLDSLMTALPNTNFPNFGSPFPSNIVIVYGVANLSVPEPASVTLLGIGSIAGMAVYCLCRRKQTTV